MRRSISTVALAAVTLAGLVACDPVPPPPLFLVTTTADGGDAYPGDGACETAPGNGTCTLTAAVEEGNALGRAVIHVPYVHQTYYPTLSATITGHLTIRGVEVGSAPMTESYGADLVIEDGGVVELHRFGFSSTTDLRVEGTLVAIGSGFYSPPAGIVVSPSGTAVFVSTLLFDISGNVPLITNHGTVAFRHATLAGHYGTSPMIVTTPGATTRLEATTLHHEDPIDAICAGETPVSGGYNSSTDDTCGLTGVGDQPNSDPNESPFEPQPGSSQIDAIPPGTLGCGDGGLDVIGRPRASDGDGDGIAQCDIGAWEWQP